jgi:hypothetical protein
VVEAVAGVAQTECEMTKMKAHSRFAAPVTSAFIADQWAEELATTLKTTVEKIRGGEIDLFSIPLTTVRVELMDDSFVEFRCSFFVVSESKRAIAIFTEHCGYHVFPFHEAKIFSEGSLIYEQRSLC